MSGTISVLTATSGRKCLKLLQQSFLAQDLHEQDRLVLLGDDWSEPWAEELAGPQVRFKHCTPKAPYYGHAHVQRAKHDVTTTHWTMPGDDEMYLPGAFRQLRPYLTPGRLLIVGGINFQHTPTGKPFFLLRGNASGRLVVSGAQAFFPTSEHFIDVSNCSDAAMVREFIRRNGPERIDAFNGMVVATSACLGSEEGWRKWGLDRITPWLPEFNQWRPRDGGLRIGNEGQ